MPLAREYSQDNRYPAMDLIDPPQLNRHVKLRYELIKLF